MMNYTLLMICKQEHELRERSLLQPTDCMVYASPSKKISGSGWWLPLKKCWRGLWLFIGQAHTAVPVDERQLAQPERE